MKYLCLTILSLFTLSFSGTKASKKAKTIRYKNIDFDVFWVDLNTDELNFHWKKENGDIYRNFTGLKTNAKEAGKELIFATNGGIYDKGNIPKGLYIENGKKLGKLDLRKGKGNFYLKPNGVFYITKDHKAGISDVVNFKIKDDNIQNALQSGPLLLKNKKIHTAFRATSKSKYIRNGVGLIDENTLVFVITKQSTNLHTFAAFFKEEMKCTDALYLDGAISKMYLPALGRTRLNGNFASMISVTR